MAIDIQMNFSALIIEYTSIYMESFIKIRKFSTNLWALQNGYLSILGAHPENVLFEPRCEKTGFRGFLQGPTQTGLYSHRT